MNKFFRYIFLSACCLLALSIQAQQFYNQQLAQAEYFWGTTDPGTGNGTPLAAQDGAYSDAVEAVIASAAGVPANGLNLLNVRLRNYNGTWGPVFKAVVNADAVFTADLKVTQAEYFIDADPGTGAATALLALDGNLNSAIEATFRTGITAPSPGLHTIGVRVLGTNGAWGAAFKAIINVDANFTADLKITAGEYFIDTDPGQGAATALLAFDGNYSDAIETALKGSIAAPSLGLHAIHARFKGSNTFWGPVFKLVVNVDANFASDLKVTAAEYYFDTDPGEGSATAMLAADGNYNDAIEAAISSAATAALVPGNHILAVRMKGFDGVWGPVFKLVVVVDGCSPLPSASISAGSSTTICPGDSVVLNASTGTGLTYQWRKDGANIQGATAASYWAKQSGAYDVAVTNTSGCGAISSAITVTLAGNSAAQVTIAANSSTTVCAGATVSFTATAVSGGTSPVYQWRINNTAAGTNSPAFSTTALSNNDIVSCIMTSNAVCVFPLKDTSNTISITVYTAPTATVTANGPTTFCQGGSVGLSALPGYSYVWNNSLTSQSITATTADTYTVTVTDGNNCTAVSAPLTVSVGSSTTASISPATVNICSGTSSTLTASGGGTYTWSNSLGSNASVTISPTSTTTYTITVSNGNCSATASRTITVRQPSSGSFSVAICQGQSYPFNGINRTTPGAYLDTLTNAAGCDSIVTLNLTVNPAPTANISPATAAICNGGSIALTASGGGTYTWSNSLGSNVSATVSPTTTTTYTVTVSNGNCSTSASRSVTVNALPNAAINGPSSVCSGLPATLTASGGAGYVWANGLGTSAQINVAPTINTAYTVTVTDGNGCTKVATQTITVTSSATASISGATKICAGQSATLTANGGNTYAWANGLGSNAQVSVSPLATTTYTVTVSVGANCTATASHTVAVNQPAAAQFGKSICSGQSFFFNGVNRTQGGIYKDTLSTVNGCDSVVTLTLTVAPAVTGSKTATICSGGTYAFNGQLLTQSGTYKDTLQSTGGCDSILTLTLNVNTVLNGSLTASICGGSYIFNGQQLTQPGIYKDTLQSINGCDSIITLTLNASTILQTNIAGAICSGQVYLFGGTTISQAGTYTDTMQSVNGCDSIITLSLTINSLPLPVVFRAGDTLTTQTYSSYQWLLNNAAINGATSQLFQVPASGSYSVQVTDAHGCSNTSNPVGIFGVGISEAADAFGVKLFPNPNQGIFTLAFTDEVARDIEITNALGQVVVEKYAMAGRRQFDLLQHADGVYFVHIRHKQYSRTLKFTMVK